LIYSQGLGLHEKALEELHFVIENRDSLDRYLTQSDYFKFMLQEMKQVTFEKMRDNA